MSTTNRTLSYRCGRQLLYYRAPSLHTLFLAKVLVTKHNSLQSLPAEHIFSLRDATRTKKQATR